MEDDNSVPNHPTNNEQQSAKGRITVLIRRVESYVGSRGERIEALVLVDSDSEQAITEAQAAEMQIEEPLVVYAGVATIMSGIPGPDGRPVAAIPNELRFPLEANDVAAAIQAYQGSLQEFVNQLENQQREARQKAAAKPDLYVPDAAESKAINKLKLTGFKSE